MPKVEVALSIGRQPFTPSRSIGAGWFRRSSVPPARWPRRLLVCGFGLLLGCGGANVSVPPQFPIPLVDRLPLVMGVHLPGPLLTYEHRERVEDSGEWVIELGGAQTTMFDNLLTGMFDGIRPVADPSAPDAGVDGVLVPNIEEVQFSTPEQTRSDYFEVWVRYRFQLHDQDGTSVGEWTLTAYGKADSGNYGLNNRSPALQAAALAALRDAMAFFTVQFRTVPPVQTWLNAHMRGV